MDEMRVRTDGKQGRMEGFVYLGERIEGNSVVHLLVEPAHHIAEGGFFLLRPEMYGLGHTRTFKDTGHSVTVVNFLRAHGADKFTPLRFRTDKPLLGKEQESLTDGGAADIELFRY